MLNPFEGSPNPCRLLIIAPAAFAHALQPLLRHKNRTGMPAHLVTLEQIILPLAKPATHPFAIKKVIAQGHLKHGTYYVMLVGDASLIPVRHRFVRQPDGGALEGMDGTYNPTDHYYANLYRTGSDGVVSDWDVNHDGKHGEYTWSISPKDVNVDQIDGYPHVAVGRVPAHTESDVINYVTKAIEFEEGLRARSTDTLAFIADPNLGAATVGNCEQVISAAQSANLPTAEFQRFQANTTDPTQLTPTWASFGSPSSLASCLSAKWLVHIGHGFETGWALKSIGQTSFGAKQVLGWNDGATYALPLVLSAGCLTGSFLNWAPNHGRYRGLSPDQPREYTFDATAQTVKDIKGHKLAHWPLVTPPPHPYDFPDASGRTFAHAWLCGSPYGGAVAYSGAMVVHEGGAWGTRLFERMLKHAGEMNILGDLWAQGLRDYCADDTSPDNPLGSAYVYPGIQTLFGDPSLRLTPVVSLGLGAVQAGDRLTVFARTAHGTLTHKFYDPATQRWTDWIHLGEGQISSGPSALMAGERLTVFARAAHGVLTHKYYDRQQQRWTDWIHFDGQAIASGPCAVMAGERLVVFARNLHSRLTHRYFDVASQSWTGWIDLGGEAISSAPSAVMAHGRLTVFARSANGGLVHRYYAGGWTDWMPVDDGEISSAPSAMMAGERLVVFARTAHNTLTHRYCDPGGSWSNWLHLENAPITSSPQAVMAGRRLTVFARNAQLELTHRYFDPDIQAWTDWIALGSGHLS